jgi:hypothetical protein
MHTVCGFPYIYSDFISMYVVTFENKFGVFTIGWTVQDTSIHDYFVSNTDLHLTLQ